MDFLVVVMKRQWEHQKKTDLLLHGLQLSMSLQLISCKKVSKCVQVLPVLGLAIQVVVFSIFFPKPAWCIESKPKGGGIPQWIYSSCLQNSLRYRDDPQVTNPRGQTRGKHNAASTRLRPSGLRGIRERLGLQKDSRSTPWPAKERGPTHSLSAPSVTAILRGRPEPPGIAGPPL